MNQQSFEEKEKDKDEEAKADMALPTGDSTNIVSSAMLARPEEAPKDLGEEGLPTGPKSEDEMITAIKSLQKPYTIDPLARYDYDSFVVESFQR